MGAVNQKCPVHNVEMIPRMITNDDEKGIKREMFVCPEPGCKEKA